MDAAAIDEGSAAAMVAAKRILSDKSQAQFGGGSGGGLLPLNLQLKLAAEVLPSSSFRLKDTN